MLRTEWTSVGEQRALVHVPDEPVAALVLVDADGGACAGSCWRLPRPNGDVYLGQFVAAGGVSAESFVAPLSGLNEPTPSSFGIAPPQLASCARRELLRCAYAS